MKQHIFALLGCAAATLATATALAADTKPLIIDNTDPGFSTEKNMSVSILLYHALTDEYANKTFDKDIFVAQIKELRESGFESITMKQMADWITSGTPALPTRPILFAFDDNYATVYSVAYPTLKKFGFFGYNFVHSRYVGVKTAWDHNTWEQIREMEKDGTILTESHTVTHTALPTLSDDNLTTEIAWSKRDIEANMPGKTVRYLSIPFSQIDDRVIPAAKAAGFEACILGSGPTNTRDTDIFLMTHFGMNPTPDLTPEIVKGYASKGLNTGSWTTTATLGSNSDNCAMMTAGDGTATACWQWTPKATEAAEIDVFIPKGNIATATNATYTIKHKNGTTTATINQAANAGKWVSLGTYDMARGKSAYVALNNMTDGTVVADAIRIRPTPKTK